MNKHINKQNWPIHRIEPAMVGKEVVEKFKNRWRLQAKWGGFG